MVASTILLSKYTILYGNVILEVKYSLLLGDEQQVIVTTMHGGCIYLWVDLRRGNLEQKSYVQHKM